MTRPRELPAEAEVADLRGAVLSQPDVARFEVAVHHALLVSEGEPAAHVLRNLRRTLQRSWDGKT